MNYEQFTNNLKLINDNLTTTLIEKEKVSQDLFLKASKALLENKDYALVFLSSLETKLKENAHNKQKQISDFEAEIVLLKQKLDEDLTEFNKNNVLDNDKVKLLNLKEEKLVEPRAIKKKEIQEINQKITLLDKECLQILKDNEQALIEEEKSFKTKLIDLERKMKFEVNKISEAILTPIIKETEDSEESKEEGEVNLEQEKRLVAEARRTGVIEIARIKNEYYNELKQIEIAFSNFKSNIIRNKAIIREEYDQKIAELNLERRKHQIELQKQTDLYDFDVYKNLFANESAYATKINEFKLDANKACEIKEDEIYTVKKSKLDLWQIDLQSIFDYIHENDKANVESYLNNISNEYELLNSMLHKTNEAMSDVIDSFKNLIVLLLTQYWDSSSLYEKELYNNLVFVNYEYQELSSWDKEIFTRDLSDLLSEYGKRQKARFIDFINNFDEQIKILLKQVNTIFNTIYDYLQNEKKLLLDFVLFMQNWLKKLKDKSNAYLSDEYYATNKLISEEKASIDLALRTEVEEINLDNKKNNNNYLNKVRDLNIKIDNYEINLKKDEQILKQEYNAFLSKSKANIVKYRSQYKKELQDDLSNINHKYNGLRREAEIERKTKIKMGKI